VTKLSEIKEGDVLIADGGFTCIPEGRDLPVESDPDGKLYFLCQEGRHYLDGQLADDGDTLVGLTRKSDDEMNEHHRRVDEARAADPKNGCVVTRHSDGYISLEVWNDKFDRMLGIPAGHEPPAWAKRYLKDSP
jgi:hypothetical protein